jgi:predicted lactoylglutathione lyase
MILFVTTDIYKKVKITTNKMYSNDEKTDMIVMANVIKILLPLQVYADNRHFPKNSSFFHNVI